LDDDTIDAIVTGEVVDCRFDDLALFARSVQMLGQEPVPLPSPALEALFAGHRHGPGVPLRRGKLTTTAAKVAGFGLVAKIGLGTSLAAAGVMVAGAGGMLPDPATRGVRAGIEAVTPLDFGGSRTSDDPSDQDDRARFGDRVSLDAAGQSDGSTGVDGSEISDEAPGAAHRPNEATEGRGLDRALETPAAPRLPEEPGDPDDSDDPDADAGSATISETPGGTAPGRAGNDSEAAPPSTVPSPSIPAPGGGAASTAPGG
jgi:hypothetical protein